jgi:lysophospholipase L1-like esterase
MAAAAEMGCNMMRRSVGRTSWSAADVLVGVLRGQSRPGGRQRTGRSAPLLILLMLFAGASLRAETFYLTIAGLGGEPEYEQRFTGWAKDLDKLLHTAEPTAKIETLMGADATRANIEARLRDIAKQAKPDDTVIVMMIGHGSFDEIDYKFNIPGSDISATELAALLDKIPSKHQLVVNMTSASGASIVPLEKPNRVVVAATKSGTENNATYFARYWIEALRDPAADTDKNETISALEAFRYAEEKTAKFFETQKRLATEHALIEDTGKGEGVKAPAPDNGEGLVAGRLAVLHLGVTAAQVNDPEKLKLLKHKEEVEQAIDELKYEKAAMELSDYRKKLNDYLVDLAKTQEALDK